MAALSRCYPSALYVASEACKNKTSRWMVSGGGMYEGEVKLLIHGFNQRAHVASTGLGAPPLICQ